MSSGSLLFPTDIESAYTYRHYHWGLAGSGARTDGMGNCPDTDSKVYLKSIEAESTVNKYMGVREAYDL